MKEPSEVGPPRVLWFRKDRPGAARAPVTRGLHRLWCSSFQGECKTNYLHDVRYLPLCNASIAIPSTFRLCPCVPEAALEAKPSLISEAGGDA